MSMARIDPSKEDELWVTAQNAKDDFLNSPEGKEWSKKRTQMRQSLVKSLPVRVKSLRQSIIQIRSISPVPNSLKKADAHVTNYSFAMEHLLDYLKEVVYQKNSLNDASLIDEDEKIQKHYALTISELGRYIDRSKRKKVYVPG